MIQPNRIWSINLTKESLLKEIDEEIQKEYQILNKFSSEKFSNILVIFGFLTIIASLWTLISPTLKNIQMGLFFVISADLLILYWNYAEFIKNLIYKILRIKIERSVIGPNIVPLNDLKILFMSDERTRF